VQQQNHFAVRFTVLFAPKASSVANRTPYTKSLPPCLAVFAELRFAGVSARSPETLPMLAWHWAPRAVCSQRTRPRTYLDWSCDVCVPRKFAPRQNPPRHPQSPTQVQMVHALPDHSTGCSTRQCRRRDSSDARGLCYEGEGLWTLTGTDSLVALISPTLG